jgi:hypothetical protein
MDLDRLPSQLQLATLPNKHPLQKPAILAAKKIVK